jgi:hypothetical protein
MARRLALVGLATTAAVVAGWTCQAVAALTAFVILDQPVAFPLGGVTAAVAAGLVYAAIIRLDRPVSRWHGMAAGCAVALAGNVFWLNPTGGHFPERLTFAVLTALVGAGTGWAATASRRRGGLAS